METVPHIVVPDGFMPIHVYSYDEYDDIFKVSVPCNDWEGKYTLEWDDWVDMDDFHIPGAALPFLVGASGEPDELVGQIFIVPLRKDVVTQYKVD